MSNTDKAREHLEVLRQSGFSSYETIQLLSELLEKVKELEADIRLLEQGWADETTRRKGLQAAGVELKEKVERLEKERDELQSRFKGMAKLNLENELVIVDLSSKLRMSEDNAGELEQCWKEVQAINSKLEERVKDLTGVHPICTSCGKNHGVGFRAVCDGCFTSINALKAQLQAEAWEYEERPKVTGTYLTMVQYPNALNPTPIVDLYTTMDSMWGSSHPHICWKPITEPTK